MAAPIALQLYTVREALREDYEGVVRRVARMGYVGVEPFSFGGTAPAEAARLFRELELAVPSAHCPMPLGDRRDEVMETMAALGSRRIVSGLGPEEFGDRERIRRACDLFNEADRVARENGLTFAIHNHWWEFQPVNGRYAYELMLEHLEPTVLFELDTYWIKVGGPDPAAVVRQFGARAPLLHVKDGPAVAGEPMTAVGQGTLDYPAIIQAGQGNTEWLIVELDQCATDMLAAVQASYSYLVGKGLAHGKAA